jgi:hypothetical protein
LLTAEEQEDHGGKRRAHMPTKRNILVKDSEKFGGKFVATRSFKNKKVVSHGTDPTKVFNEAKEKGVRDPVVFYVPQKNITQIY